MSRNIAIVREALRTNEGLLRLAPCWVPRPFNVPGGRLRLHPHDLYALGAHRGGIDERWFCSTTNARNGPGTPHDEGLSYIDVWDQRILFKDAIDEIGDPLLRDARDPFRAIWAHADAGGPPATSGTWK